MAETVADGYSMAVMMADKVGENAVPPAIRRSCGRAMTLHGGLDHYSQHVSHYPMQQR